MLRVIVVEPWAAACLAAAAMLYAIGVRRLWKRAGAGRGISRADVARFATGWLLTAAALLSPLDEWAERSFAAHMTQHEILMAAAAPFLVLGRPLEAWTWALAPPWRVALGGAARSRWLRAGWRAATSHLGAWTLHAVALWAWHIPAVFEAALAAEGVHIAQHACFLGTALFFWWSVFDRGRRDADAASLASLFTTMAHTGALGALLTFAQHPWYASYASGVPGLTPLEDQQLGGLIMWAPASLAYLVAALVIASRWLLPPRRTAGSSAASSHSSC